MTDMSFLPSDAFGPCLECGGRNLQPVSDGEVTNFLCGQCKICWHFELDWVRRVNPATCPGCNSRDVCLSAPRAYGEARPLNYRVPLERGRRE